MLLICHCSLWGGRHIRWRRNEFENGGTRPAQIARKILAVVSLHIFGSTSTTGRFGGRFRDGQYSLVSFLLAVLTPMVYPPPKLPILCRMGR